MADIVLAVHVDGVLRCYRRGPDGALTQTAQLVAHIDDPTALAQLVGDLAALAEPHPNGHTPRPIEATATPRRPYTRARMTADAVLDDLRAHPGTTYAEIAARLTGDGDDRRAINAISTHLGVLRRQSGHTIETRRADGGQGQVTLTYVAGPDTARPSGYVKPQSRPRATYAERDRRRDAALAYVQAHPGCTVRDVALGVFGDETHQHTQRTRAVLGQLADRGLVRSAEQGPGIPWIWHVVEHPPDVLGYPGGEAT